MEVLQSDALTQKSYKSHLLKARLRSLGVKYSMLPAKLHKFSITLGELKTQFDNLPVICCFSTTSQWGLCTNSLFLWENQI